MANRRRLEHDFGIEILALGDDFIAQPVAAAWQSRRRNGARETWLHREIDADWRLVRRDERVTDALRPHRAARVHQGLANHADEGGVAAALDPGARDHRVADDPGAQIRQRYPGRHRTLAVVHADDGTDLERQTHLNRGGIGDARDWYAAGLDGNHEPQPVFPVCQSDGRPREQAHGLPLPRGYRQTPGEGLNPRERRGQCRVGILGRVQLDAAARVRGRIAEHGRDRDFDGFGARIVEQHRSAPLTVVDEHRMRCDHDALRGERRTAERHDASETQGTHHGSTVTLRMIVAVYAPAR